MTDSIIVSSFLRENIRLVFFGNWWFIDLENTHWRSLMYRRNNQGPVVDPWVTLHWMVLMLEETPCGETYCLRFLKKSLRSYS